MFEACCSCVKFLVSTSSWEELCYSRKDVLQGVSVKLQFTCIDNYNSDNYGIKTLDLLPPFLV